MERKSVLLVILLTIFAAAPYAKSPIICESEYALCTTAKCFPCPSNPKKVLCTCSTQSGYSAGFEDCQKPKAMVSGFKQIKSRYYPISQYLNCSNNRAWANCLDSPCVVDEKDPSKAICACTLVENKGEYMVVTNNCDKSQCDTDIYSSILTKDSMSNFLSHQDKLPKIEPKVCN